MDISTIQLVCLTPRYGYHIKNKETGEIAEGKVYPGKNVSLDIFEEVTDSAYEEWLQERERKLIEEAEHNPNPKM